MNETVRGVGFFGPLLLFLGVASYMAAAANGFSFTQITTDGDACSGFNGPTIVPSISADGTVIAFLSCRMGAANPNIFVYDAATGMVTQSTHTTACQNYSPVLSGDGKWIAFLSDCDLTGGNADRNKEVFLFDRTANSTRQITNTMGFGIFEIAINGDGTRLAITSNPHLTDSGSELNPDLYLFDTIANNFTRLTMGPVCQRSVSPSINADGTRIAFLSSCKLTDKPRSPLKQQYLVDTTTGIITEITSDNTCADLCNGVPSISADGEHVAFASSLNLTGQTDGNYELFLFDVSSSALVQATTTARTQCQNGVYGSAVNEDGTRIALTSSCNLSGDNADFSAEVFLFDTTSGTFMSITDTHGCSNQSPSLSADGTRIALQSTCDLSGGNATNNAQIFLGQPGTSPMTPTPTATMITTVVPTQGPISCVGDCNNSDTVTVDELVRGVNIALDTATLDRCPAFDCNGN